MDGLPTLLLVHGAWMGPWQWDFVATELERLSLPYATVALPSCGQDPSTLGSLADDARAVETAIASIDGDVIVVAHSYGGVVATETNLPPNARHVVYLGAFMPDLGRSLASYLPPGALPPFVQVRDDGTTTFAEAQIPVLLCNECTEERVHWLIERIQLHSVGVVATPVSRTSWRMSPSTYVVFSNDLIVPTELQRVFARQATNSVELASDHMPMLSHPDELARTLVAIREAVGNRTGVMANAVN